MSGHWALSHWVLDPTLLSGGGGGGSIGSPIPGEMLRALRPLKWVKPLAVFPRPTQGVDRGIPAYELPPEALRNSLNCILREQVLMPRPGMDAFGSPLTSTITGGYLYTSIANVPYVVVGTRTGQWAGKSDETWQAITGPALTATLDQQSVLFSYQCGDVIYAVHTNGANPPSRWNGASLSNLFEPIGGNPDLWTDACVVENRIVGIVPPYLVTWGEPARMDLWPALNFRALSDTPDPLVAIKPIGAAGATLYKTESIWIAQPVAGTSAGAFTFEFRVWADGPAGKKAIAQCNGVDIYMTADGRVGAWDGHRHEWIADQVWTLLRDDIDSQYSNRIHGAYDGRHNVVYFYYPRINGSGALTGLLTINLPSRDVGNEHPACFPGRLSVAATASMPIRMSNLAKKVMVFSPSAQAATMEGTTDLGAVFEGYFQTGMAGTPQLGLHRIDGLEMFFDRGVNYGSVELTPQYSYSPIQPDGTDAATVVVDLTEATVFTLESVDVRGRFFGLRVDFESDAVMRYRGAAPYTRVIGESKQ